ncbi:polysaccharide biosynthesis PFTS motif protein [Leptospira kirschneri]|uniref:polysaccharide biosynthesis PFTS motif protein n=1 Tax=Leptospira kirschneri TaxID=29507 RepID=UPI003561E63D
METRQINKYNFYYYFNLEIEKFLQKIRVNYSIYLTKNEINRICQIILNFSYHSLFEVSAKIKNIQESLDFYELDNYIRVENIKVNIKRGIFKLTLKYKVKIICRSLIYCLYAVKNMVIGFLLGSKLKESKYTIVSDLSVHKFYLKDKMSEFKNAIDEDYFPILKNSKYILIKSSPFHNLKFSNIAFYRHPIFGILSEINWNILDIVLLLWSLLSFLSKEFFLIFFSDHRFLLLEDRLKRIIVTFLGKFNLIEYFIITNSDCISQELYLSDTPNKNFKTVMFWYSTNSKFFKYKERYANPNETIFPWSKILNVDVHYVWNLDQKNWLHDLGSKADVIIYGPILLNNPYKKLDSEVFDGSFFNIIIFDVTPVSPDFEAMHFSHAYIFYSLRNSIETIDDILIWAKNKKVKIYIKQKREFSHIHNQEYIQFIKGCVERNELLSIDHNVSLDFILDPKINFVLCSPFTSISNYASFYQKESAYYDPSLTLECNVLLEDKQHFLSGKIELFKCLDERYLAFMSD